MIILSEYFGGVGSPRYALEKIAEEHGLKVISLEYVEKNKNAVKAYNVMYGESYQPQDIVTHVPQTDFEIDVLAHGSPCQDWSKNGKGNVETGRSILYRAQLDKIRSMPIKPRVVIWENVPNLVHAHREHFDHYLNTMLAFGYVNHWEIVDSKNYGLPQSRPRVKVVSIRSDIVGATTFKFPIGNSNENDIMDYIDRDSESDHRPLNDDERSLLTYDQGQLYVNEATKAGKTLVEQWDCINLEFPKSKTRRGRVGKRMSKTILTSPRQAIYYDNTVRMLSSKEHVRLMGYDDDVHEKLTSIGLSPNQITFLMGNSIAVPVMEEIFRALFDQGILKRG